MKCPYCGFIDSKVVDSRDTDLSVRRRRQCLACQTRFTTYERVQEASLFVIKKDGRREEFNRDKLVSGIRKACEKRPLPTGTVEKLVDETEAELFRLGRPEVSSILIGDMVMDRLKNLDQIAYIRFASVYREFADLTMLKQAVDNLAKAQVKHSSAQLALIPELDTISTPRAETGHKKSRV
jgi:transcriptional repressor NrdR